MTDAAPFMPANPSLARTAMGVSGNVAPLAGIVTDCNDVPLQSGFFTCYDATNAPGAGGWFGTQIVWPNGVHAIQICETAFPAGTPVRYRRYRNGPGDFTGWSLA